MNNKKAKINLQPAKVEQVEALINDIKKEGTLPEIDSVLEMLSDLKNKIQKGDKVPSYLKNALSGSLKNNAEFAEQLDQILE